MPIIDILIAVAVLVSIIVGVFRGFVKEAISVAALLIAIWAALYFGPEVGDISDNWFKSEELQMWFGRVLVFLVILALGGLLGWGISKLVHLSVLSGMDRLLGAVFGLARGIVLVAVAIIGGEFAGFDNDAWWLESSFIPQIEVVADWIKVMAPEGLDIITPDEQAEELPIEI
jgi:membrane protein required for colicin V production